MVAVTPRAVDKRARPGNVGPPTERREATDPSEPAERLVQLGADPAAQLPEPTEPSERGPVPVATTADEKA